MRTIFFSSLSLCVALACVALSPPAAARAGQAVEPASVQCADTLTTCG